MVKEVASFAAIALTFVIFWPYIRSTRSGAILPHAFSWIIWTLVTLSVFFAQLAGGAGQGAWAIGLSGLLTAYVAGLAWVRRATLGITVSDYLFLGGALTALPAWWLTDDPLSAVVILTAVDLSGFGPTVRRAWSHPEREQVSFYAMAALRNTLVIAALEQTTITTALFPAAVGVGCVLLCMFVLARRRQFAPRL